MEITLSKLASNTNENNNKTKKNHNLYARERTFSVKYCLYLKCMH